MHSMQSIRAHCGARHQSIVTSMQPLWGVIIWSMSIHKQPCNAACKQPCAHDAGIRKQSSPRPSHQPSHHPSHPHRTAPEKSSTAAHRLQPQPQPSAPATSPSHRHRRSAKTPRMKPTSLPKKVRTPARKRCLGKNSST